MLQRFVLLQPKRIPRIFPTLTLPSLLRRLSSFSSSRQSSNFPNKSRAFLNPKSVHSTLLNCPCDITSLSLFLWCAKQPNYFHDPFAFDHMVHVVLRLLDKFINVRGLIFELETVGHVVKAQTFLLLLRILWVGKRHDLVVEVSLEMQCRDYYLNVFVSNVFMDICFTNDLVGEALNFLKEETPAPNFLSFTFALCHLSKINDLVNLRNVLVMMLNAGYYPKRETWELVLNCFCRVGRIGEAFQLLNLMTTSGIGVSLRVWTMLISCCSVTGKIVLAGVFLEKMVDSGCSPSVVTYTCLVRGFFESGDVSSVLTTLNRMQETGCRPDLVLCNSLISGFAKMGRYDDAVGVCNDLVKLKLEPDKYTFSSVLSSLNNTKEFNLLPVLTHLWKVEGDMVVFNSLLSYFSKSQNPSNGVQLYRFMEERGLVPDKYTFAGFLGCLCKEGRTKEAVNEFCRIVKNHSGVDAHGLTVIMDGLIKAGKFHEAIKLFRKVNREKFPLDAVSYTVAIRGLCEGGRTEEACVLYEQMKEVGLQPNTRSYNELVRSFCQSRNVEMVRQTLQEMIDAGVQLDLNLHFTASDVDFLWKTLCSLSTSNLPTQILNSEMLTPEAIEFLKPHGLNPGINLDDGQLSLLKRGGVNKDLIADLSSSDNYDEAASVS